MRAISCIRSILLVTFSVFACLVLAGKYEGAFDVVPNYGTSHVGKDGDFPKTLAAVLQGKHRPSFDAFPNAEVTPLDERPVPDTHVIDILRANGDNRHFFILGAPFPDDTSKKGFSVAFPVGLSKQNPTNHLFAFASVEHIKHAKPVVHLNGFARVDGAPGIAQLVRSHRVPHRDIFYATGNLVTAKELFAALPMGL